MLNWLRNRKHLILQIVGMHDELHEIARDLHWTHGMLATFKTCDDLKCKRAREILTNTRNFGVCGREINKSVNLWNDNDELRSFAIQMIAEVITIGPEIQKGTSAGMDRLRALAAKPPFALLWGEKPQEERKERYG